MLLQALEPDIVFAQLRDEGGNQVLERAAEPIQPPDHQGIPCPQVVHSVLQTGPLRLGTAHRIGEELLTTCLGERIGLEVEGLVLGGDAGVPYQHACPLVLGPRTAPVARSSFVAYANNRFRARRCRERGSGGRRGRSPLPWGHGQTRCTAPERLWLLLTLVYVANPW